MMRSKILKLSQVQKQLEQTVKFLKILVSFLLVVFLLPIKSASIEEDKEIAQIKQVGKILGLSIGNAISSQNLPQTENSIFISEINEKKVKKDQFYLELNAQYQFEKEMEADVQRLNDFLTSQGSRIANTDYVRDIIRISRESGTDYKAIVAIMGVESGFCNANYKKYNCFGWLNGVQYAGFTEAFEAIIPQIHEYYISVYGTDFRSFAQAYGIKNVDYHAPRLTYFYNAI